jgi:hypothetical protein
VKMATLNASHSVSPVLFPPILIWSMSTSWSTFRNQKPSGGYKHQHSRKRNGWTAGVEHGMKSRRGRKSNSLREVCKWSNCGTSFRSLNSYSRFEALECSGDWWGYNSRKKVGILERRQLSYQ